MRRFFVLGMSGFLVLGVAISSFAKMGSVEEGGIFKTCQAQEGKSGSEAVEVGNKICPVSGKEIKEEEKFQVEYEGKIYNLCCKMCAKDFKKDPEKYIKKLEELEEEHTEHGHHHEGHHHSH